jgi:carboxypeptidase Taq
MECQTPAYDRLVQAFTRLHHLKHLQSMAEWDQAAMMPPGGNEARSAALTELAGVLHRLRTDGALAHCLQAADDEPLAPAQRANLREMKREWARAHALPEALVARRTLVASRCEHAWRQQRPANDWAGFAANLRQVVATVREEAQHLAEHSGLGLYDAMLDQYEPGMTTAALDRAFGAMRGWLPGLIQQVSQRQAAEPPLQVPLGPFPVSAQKALCEQVMQWLGFDFQGGRLDVSTHPFSGGVPEDVRLTTRFDEQDLLVGLMSTVHETGHGRYEQNLPREWLSQPLGLARSMGIHESQSLAFEMQLGGHPAFARRLSPLLQARFGPQSAFEPAALQRWLTRVQPGLIRVEADEVTYPAHVLLRYDIERALIEGEVEVDDIPALWDAGMASLLGLDTRGNFRDGPMQDVHWAVGLFGYFPCYSLGAMYAAQWLATLRREQPDLDATLMAGDFSQVLEWLRSRIWQQGSRWTTDELALQASGEVLNPEHFHRHLRARYLGEVPR